MLPPPGFRDVVLCGTGATSRVFRATSAASGRTVALKRLHRQLARTPEAVTRLRRELEALGKLHHRAIVPVFDVIRWQGDPTIVMDYVPGRDLKELIQSKGPLSCAEAERIMRELLDALFVAHGAGIVHRDVKPQNVRIGEDGRVFLLDFGSARLDASSQLTATGTSVGTPDYMAPELFAGPVYDPRADLYGVGATIFEALTGRAPQVTESLTELAWRRTNEDVPPVRTLREDTPEALAQVVDRCLARAPEDRYATAARAIWALDHPFEEKRLLARRSKNPPCIHCGIAIAPESNICPGCGSDHPFCFRSGHASVNLVALKDPEPIALELTATFPELSIDDLAERFAAVNTSPQRLVSLIDKKEAIAFADRLRELGADCQVEEDPGISGANTKAPFWGAIVLTISAILAVTSLPLELATFFVLAAMVPAVGAMLLERFYAIDRASQGVLAGNAASPAPAARFALTAAAPATLAAGLVLPPLAQTLELLGVGGAIAIADFSPALLVASGITALTAFAARFVRFGSRCNPACGSAEPPLLEKIGRAFSLPDRSIAPMKQKVAGALAVAVIALVPLELATSAALRNAIPTFWSLWSRSGIDFTPRSTVEPWEPLESEAPFSPPEVIEAELAPIDPPPSDAVAVGIRPSYVPSLKKEMLPVWLDAKNGAIIGAIAAADLFLLALLLLRRRRHRKDGLRLRAELEIVPAPKILPRSRAPARALNTADRIAEKRIDDAFLHSTKRLATELAHAIDAADAAHLSALLDRARARAERSFLARCILETDSDLALRFELLRLTGKLEAKAAERWARELPEG